VAVLRLIDQILKNPGWVRLMLVLRRDLMEQLSSFPILMTVTEGLQGGDALPTEYYRVRDLADVNAELTLFANQLKQAEAQTAQAIAQHDASAYAHGDIRLRIEKLTNDKLDADRLPQALESALTEAKESGEFDGEDGYTPVRGVDYDTPEDRQALKSYITDELAKRGQLQPLFVESAEWLEANGDKSMLYVLPDGMIYAWMPTTQIGGPGYTNLLPDAVDTDGVTIYGGDYDGDGKPDGFLTDTRLSGSSGLPAVSSGGMCASGFIPASDGAVVRIKGTAPVTGVQSYLITYDSAMARLGNVGFGQDVGVWTPSAYQSDQVTYEDGILTVTLDSAVFGTGIAFVRVSGHMDENTIITVNQEISENGGTVLVEQWVSMGIGINAGDYDDAILRLNDIADTHTSEINALKKAVATGGADASEAAALERIKNWEYPIKEDAPVFLLETNKPALTGDYNSAAAVYARYDALMAQHPGYITREDLGMASDDATPIYAYHFREAEPHHEGAWSETKPTIVVCSGVHPTELTGVYGFYYAMEEVAANTKLRTLHRNAHIVVVPMINPTGFADSQYGVRNPEGIQVHYNFEVDHGANGAVQGDRNYGGEAPLSIPETQYFDALIARYQATLVCVLSCHNYDVDTYRGTAVVWTSAATSYMCNAGARLASKLSAAWRDKYGEAFDEGLRWANDYALAKKAEGSSLFPAAVEQAAWDYNVGTASISGSGGTEYKQALKYGHHGLNVESCDRHLILDKDFGKTRTENVMTTACEIYTTALLMLIEMDNPLLKREYAPNLPWEG